MRLNNVMRRFIVIGSACVAAWCLTAAAPASAQTADPPPATKAASKVQPPVSPATTPMPVNLDYIKDAVQKEPAIRFDEEQLKFYVVVRGSQSNLADEMKGYDFMNGPTKGGAPMTYAEFLQRTRPRELDELFGATSGSSFALAQAALVNAAGQAAIRKAIEAVREAHNQHQIDAIRSQIDRELQALNGTDNSQ